MGPMLKNGGWRVALLVLASLAGCGDDEERAADAGEADVDAGAERVDSGPERVDSGPEGVDSGQEPGCDGHGVEPEVCDESDNDCDLRVDEDLFCGTCTCGLRPPNATPACTAGPDQCTVGTCHEGFGDCDGVSSNGCEADLTQPDNCGVCDAVCVANAACTLAGGSYGCDCGAGYTAGDEGCVNVDECVADNGGCDPLTSCTDTPGARTCGACPTGYLRPADSDSACTQVLSDLDVSDGTLSPAFEPATTAYTLQLPLTADDVSLTPTAEAGLTVTIEGTPVDSGDPWPSPPLEVGNNAFMVSVAATGRANTVYDVQVERGYQDAYLKQSNSTEGSQFGTYVAIAGDGRTLAVGAQAEALFAGAVYVFVRPGTAWSEQIRLEAPNAGDDDGFGRTLALSTDGNTLAVGAFGESSSATGIDGNQSNSGAEASGAVYVFTRIGTAWTLQAYIKASNTGTYDWFGSSVALSSTGDTLAVGARQESSAATGVDGNQANNSAGGAGAVYVFTRTSSVWSQQAYVKASNTGASDGFGVAVSLAADGNTLAVGAANEGSAATGIDGDQANNARADSGAAYVFTRTGTVWAQQAYVKASESVAGYFGWALAMGGDGNTLAIGAMNANSGLGAAYLFTRDGSTWSQQARLTASNAGISSGFGGAIGLTSDGNALLVGASGESSAATGVQGDQDDDTATWAGAAYTFTRTGTVWAQQAYLKASNTDANDGFGYSVCYSGDGSTLAAGAPMEASKASGVNGDQSDDTKPYRGAVYVFR